jgi:hypothetical protein
MNKPSAPKMPRDRRPLVAKSLFVAALLVLLGVAALIYRIAT